MATDFFQRQAAAQRSTAWLVFLFSMAVVSIVGAVALVAAIYMQSQMREPRSLADYPQQWIVPLVAAGVALLIIVLGSIFKTSELTLGGGTRVAESLGGKRIFPNSQDAVERRLLNIVEEMAIASGTPVPPVFILEESGINAFAAGYSPSDAVLGITRGCAEQLTRDELQGVIAHEFSHILNGDMRMSIRLIGILYGILMIGLAGQFILRSLAYSGPRRSRGDSKGSGQVIVLILAIAIAAIVLGYLGMFFGNLIKAAVSRQREFLADASAVQFTRNPSGIAGALKRIGGSTAGSKLKTANAAEASHMYFSQGVWEGISGLWATHPPLAKRILAIEPNWDGKFLAAAVPAASLAAEGTSGFAAASVSDAASSADADVPIAVVDHAAEQIGEPTRQHGHYAAQIIRDLPTELLEDVHDPYGSRAIIYGLLLDKDPSVRQSQLLTLEQNAAADVLQLVLKRMPMIDALDIRARLPLVDMSLPALRSMSPSQFQNFQRCFVRLAKADQKIELFEWMLAQVLLRHLRPQFEPVRQTPVRYYGLQRFSHECSVLLSTVASAGNPQATAREAFEQASQHLPELSLAYQAPQSDALDRLMPILAKLNQVAAKHRGRVVDACAAAICADQQVKWQEAELLRGISDLLDCPMPPLLVDSAA
ncbi:MAG: M48 family metallopeptidase [bacterium]|nr:M48 family metallopeptidase [bacterium]